jgi:hypothetical protein
MLAFSAIFSVWINHGANAGSLPEWVGYVLLAVAVVGFLIFELFKSRMKFLQTFLNKVSPMTKEEQPYEVRYYPNDPIPAIRIHVLGHHNTDFAWPEYWLWVVCRETHENYKPELKYQSQWFPPTIRKMTNSIFEITY